jgi:hypothetical protein
MAALAGEPGRPQLFGQLIPFWGGVNTDLSDTQRMHNQALRHIVASFDRTMDRALHTLETTRPPIRAIMRNG